MVHPWPGPGQSPFIAGEAVLGLLPDFLKTVSGKEGIVSISDTIQELDGESHTAVNKILAKGQEKVWREHCKRN